MTCSFLKCPPAGIVTVCSPRIKQREAAMPPPTVIVRHKAENPRKCSVYPLRGRPDLIFLPYPVAERPCLDGYVRLAADGPELSPADAAAGVLLLDGSWRWA